MESEQQSSMPSNSSISTSSRALPGFCTSTAEPVLPDFVGKSNAKGRLHERPMKRTDRGLCEEVTSRYAPMLVCGQAGSDAAAVAGADAIVKETDSNSTMSQRLRLSSGMHRELATWLLPVMPPPNPESVFRLHRASYHIFDLSPSELPPDICRALIQNIDNLEFLDKAGEHTHLCAI